MKYASIALKNLNRQKKRSILLGGAIALGILVITMVNGFTAGAVQNLKDNFSYLLAGHIYLSEEIKRDDDTVISRFDHGAEAEAALAEVGIGRNQIVRRSEFGGSFIFNGNSVTQQVFGVDWQAEEALRNRLVLAQGSLEEVIADPKSLVIALNVADQLGIAIGEELTVRTTTVTGQQNVGSFIVRGFMADPGILGSIAAYAPIAAVNELINIPADSYQSINVTLATMAEVDPMTALVKQALARNATVIGAEESGMGAMMGGDGTQFTFKDEPEAPWSGYRIQVLNINDMTSQIEVVSATVNYVGVGILVVLIVITMVGVTNTFRMIMYERVKEIGTMRALGMQKPIIRRIFLYEASSLAALGYFLGVLIAGIAGLLVGLIQVPSDNPFSLFTNNGSLSFPIQVPSFLFNFILIVAMTALAALVPARKAANLQPADALRA